MGNAFLAVLGVVTVAGLAIRAKSARGSSTRLSTNFDSIFRRHCGQIPLAYLRSLARHESNFDPRDTNGPAWGLMQITEVLRRDFNRRKGTNFSREDLLNPNVNVRIACDLLNRIARLYARNHPRTFGGRFNFDNRRHVELLTFGWNAGFSEGSGVGYVVGRLEAKAFLPAAITADAVHGEALIDQNASRFLRIPRRFGFSKKVTSVYFRNRRTEA